MNIKYKCDDRIQNDSPDRQMTYGENGVVNFLETLADNAFRHNYSMMQI
jgi:hypothetical protein